MNIIVTGGRGFIGHCLVKKLSGCHDVTVIDNNLMPYVDDQIKGVKYYECCVSKIIYFKKADVVFHLGEYSRVEQSNSEPEKVKENTIKTIASVLEYCRLNNAKLIYAGSSTKFGDKKSIYSIYKSINSSLVKEYCEFFNMNYCIVYFYNVYGKLERDKGKYATVVGKFLRIKKENKTATINGDGEQKRTFTHINDAINALIIIMEKGQGDDYGIAGNDTISINELAKLIGVKNKNGRDKKGNRKNYIVMNQKTLSLGWEPVENINNYIKSRL